MFEKLPEHLQQEVLYHLQKNDFPKAKIIHDAWLETQNLNSSDDFLDSEEE